MGVCESVYIYVRMCVYMYVRVCGGVCVRYVCVSLCVRVTMRFPLYVCVGVCVYLGVGECMWDFMSVCTNVFLCL